MLIGFKSKNPSHLPVAGVHRVVPGQTELWQDDSVPVVTVGTGPASPVEEDVLHHRVESHRAPAEQVSPLAPTHGVPLRGDHWSSRHS